MKSLHYLVFLIFTVLFSSCGTYAYKSVTVKTPLFEKRNDINGHLAMGGGGAEIYAAYAPINYCGLSVGYAGYTSSTDTSQANTLVAKKYRDYEFSVIPFYPVEMVRIEMPIGLGLTNNRNSNNVWSSPYVRYFLQPTIGFHWDFIETAIFCRFTQINYTNKFWGADTRYEPGFMVRAGSKNIKGFIQIRADYGTNYSKTPMAGLNPFQQVEYLPFHISFGAHFSFNLSKKAKPEGEPK